MTSLKTNTHSAPGPMLGYLFQIERALLWLSQTSPDGTVAMETDDDLVIQLKNDPDIKKFYEQDKSAALSSRNPFSNKSKDLWKTLQIWANNVDAGIIDVDKSTLFLVTNKPVNSCLIKQLLKLKLNTEEFNQKVNDFVQQAVLSESAEIKGYAETVSNLNVDTRSKLFSNIELLDLNYVHDRDQIKQMIKGNLHVSDDLPFHSIYKDLLGWLTDLIIERWVSGKQALIKGSELNNYFISIVAKYSSKPFIEKAKDVLPVGDMERGKHRKDNFVKQLDWIDLEERHVISAIDDFLRARWERSRYAMEGNIPCKDDFDKMHDDLYERWENLQSPIARNCVTEQDKKMKGYDLYWSVLNHKAKLANYDTDQYYTTKGAYHLMANDFRLGWHIDWENLKEKENEH